MDVNPKRTTSLLVGGAAVLALCFGGCAADSQDSSSTLDESVQGENEPFSPAEKDMTLLARVDFRGGSVRFYEIVPGTILEVESGRIDAEHPAEPIGLSAVQRYEFLSGKLAPQSLIAAAERAGAAESVFAEPVEQAGISVPTTTEKAADWTNETWFRENYCAATDRFWGTPAGVLWHGDSSWANGVEYMKAGAFTARGRVTYRASYSGGGISDNDYQVPAGYFVGFRRTSTINRSASSYVREANGTDNWFPEEGQVDRYVHCVNYHF